MMMYSMVNAMLAAEVNVSEPLLVGFLAVLVVLIVLLAVLSTIYTAGFRRRLRASLSKVSVNKEYDRELGRVIVSDTSNLEKAVFGGGDVVRITVKPNEGQKLSRLIVESDDGYFFTVDGTEKVLMDGVYEFIIHADSRVRVAFEPIPQTEIQQNILLLSQFVFNFDNNGGKVVLTDANGEVKNQFLKGELVRVSTVADEGYYLAKFAINGEEKELVEGVYEFVVTEPVKIDVQFLPVAVEEVAEETVAINTQFDGEGGSVVMTDANGEEKSEFAKGETVRISTVADEGYYLARFAINGEEKELVEGVYEFVVGEPVDVEIEFLPIPVETFSVSVGAFENGVVTITDADGNEQSEFAQGETVKIAVAANEGYYLAGFSVDGVDREIADTYELKIDGDMTVNATFEAIPVAQPQEEIAVTDSDEDEDDDDEVMFDGHNVIRFNKSFTAKVIQLNDVANGWYTELKNELLSYKKVKDRMSWKRESYRFGRVCVARFVIRGKTLCIQLPLDPTKFEDSKYKVEDISHIISSADTPCLYRIKNERRLGYAKELIALVMENMGTYQVEHEFVDYYQPYDTTLNLIERGLVKKIVKFNGKTGYGGIVEKLTEDPTKKAESDENTDK